MTPAISPSRAVERCERLAMLGPAPAWWRAFALRRWLRAYRAVMAMDIGVLAEQLRDLYSRGHVNELAERPVHAALRMVPRSERK
ncbi:MAG TPA: hypothetical protein VFD36_30260 [Kofleriaceae bacterium]|nr:hypothetical protein [Kofleriaceae bacterium]